MPEGDSTKFSLLIEWFENHKIFSYVLLFAVVVISIDQFTNASDSILRRTGVIKSLDLTSNRKRTELTKEMIRTSWKRMYWMRNFIAKIQKGAPMDEINASWSEVNRTTAEWSSNLMIYYISLDEYYPGTGKREFLEGRIQPLFDSITHQLANMKYDLMDSTKSGVKESTVQIQDEIDKLNRRLYFFINGVAKKEEEK